MLNPSSENVGTLSKMRRKAECNDPVYLPWNILNMRRLNKNWRTSLENQDHFISTKDFKHVGIFLISKDKSGHLEADVCDLQDFSRPCIKPRSGSVRDVSAWAQKQFPNTQLSVSLERSAQSSIRQTNRSERRSETPVFSGLKWTEVKKKSVLWSRKEKI